MPLEPLKPNWQPNIEFNPTYNSLPTFDDLPVDRLPMMSVMKNPAMSIVWGIASQLGSTLLQTFLNDRATKKNQEYNNPSAQVARLRAAGLNPQAALGQIASNNTLAYRSADVPKLNPAELLALQNQKLQNDQLREQIKSIQISNKSKLQDYYYNQQSLQDRIFQQFYKTNMYRLRAKYEEGLLSYQDLQIALKENEKAYSDWLNSESRSLSPRESAFIYGVDAQKLKNDILENKVFESDYYRKMLDEFGMNDNMPNNPVALFYKTFELITNILFKIRDGQ